MCSAWWSNASLPKRPEGCHQNPAQLWPPLAVLVWSPQPTRGPTHIQDKVSNWEVHIREFRVWLWSVMCPFSCLGLSRYAITLWYFDTAERARYHEECEYITDLYCATPLVTYKYSIGIPKLQYLIVMCKKYICSGQWQGNSLFSISHIMPFDLIPELSYHTFWGL